MEKCNIHNLGEKQKQNQHDAYVYDEHELKTCNNKIKPEDHPKIKQFFSKQHYKNTSETTTDEYDLATPDLNTNSSCESPK